MIDMTFETVRRLFTYNPGTGDLSWNYRPGARMQWNDSWAGQVVNYRMKKRYKVVTTHDQEFFAHRLGWLWYCGAYPLEVTDHINEDRGDNRIANLRDIPAWLNVSRRGQHSDNEGMWEYRLKDGSPRWKVCCRDDSGSWRQMTFYDFDEALEVRTAHLARHKAALEADLRKYGRLPVPFSEQLTL